MTTPPDAQHLLQLYLAVDEAFADARAANERETALAIAQLAVHHVPGVEQASISEGRDGRFRTLASTGDVAAAGDRVQYQLRSGPCVDVLTRDAGYGSADIADDARWSEPTRAAIAATGVRSMLAYRLFADDGQRVRVTGLNLYSSRARAFDDTAQLVGGVVALNSAHALRTAAAYDTVVNVQQALESNREIGAAIGILMASHKITRDDAFCRLRAASQHSNRKLIDVATTVVDTGMLELPERGRTGRT